HTRSLRDWSSDVCSSDLQAEYDAANRRIVVRLGTGANSTQGGSVGIGESTTLKFRVTIDLTATGVLANQAVITADGLKGNPTTRSEERRVGKECRSRWEQ